MRKKFVQHLYKSMSLNDNIWLLSGDLGFNLFEKIEQDFPRRFINCGASEQAMVDIAVGLASEGQIPFVYSITPFLIFRPFEAISIYLHHDQMPVKLIGGGRGRDYGVAGYTHYADGDWQLMFLNIECYWPTEKQLKKVLDTAITNNKPTYINLRK